MSHEPAGGTVSRLLLGRRLRQLRTRKRMDTRKAATATGLACATVWRMERGDNRCRYRSRDVAGLGRLYGTDRRGLDLLAELAKNTRARSWVGAYHDVLSDAMETYLGLEGYASHHRHYQGALVPELLQTEVCAKALLSSFRGAAILEIHKRTQVRMHRQTTMTRRRTEASFEFLLDESVLRRTVGGPAIMAAQLRRILDAGLLPHVSIRIVAGAHSGLRAGSFSVLAFPVDPRFGELDIRAHALDEQASRELVEEVLRGFEQH